MTSRLRFIAFATLAVALLVAGCGKDQTFIDGYNKATKPLTGLNRDIGGTVGGAHKESNSTISKQFTSLANRADRVNADLAALDPPDKGKQQFSELKLALRHGTADLRHAAKAAKESDSAAFASAAKSLARHGNDISRAEDALKKKVEG